MDASALIPGMAVEAAPRLRVAIVTETYPPEVNGVAMTVARLVGGLLERGHQVDLVRPRQQRGNRPAADTNLRELLTPGLGIPGYPGLRFGIPVRRALTERWRETPVDVVHVDTEGPLGWSALAAARRLALPAVTSFHTNFHQYSAHYGLGLLQRPVGGYLRRFHGRARCTLVPTRELAGELAGHGFRHLEVLGRGVDTRLFHPGHRSEALRRSWGVRGRDLVALYVGRLAPEKNLEVAVRWFHAMRSANRRVRLVMVGDGPLRERLAAEHPEIVFCGMRGGEDLAAHYASSDLFLFPSLTETFGNVVLEAMASGLPVVAYHTAAAREYVIHQWSGLLAAPGEEQALARAAATLARDPARVRRLGARARFGVQKADWQQIHERFEALLLRQVHDHATPGAYRATQAPTGGDS